jgi:holo-[acyl-carrier protein] synthase
LRIDQRRADPERPAPAAVPTVLVGVDLVAVGDVEESMRTFGERYTRRIFTPGELTDTAGPAQPARLAARFAAKEAVIKALGPSADAPGWRSIEVVTGPGGAPRLSLGGDAAELARAGGIGDWAVSLSHEGPVAVAVVVATHQSPQPTEE